MKKERKLFVLTVWTLILLTPDIGTSQTIPCALKLVDLPQAPELMGIHMGMTKEQVKARVPQVDFGRTNEFGISKTTINPDFDPRINKSSFLGVRSVSLDFLDGRLTSLWFGYDGSFKWKTVDDFVAGISASMKLPNAWQSWRTRGQQLRCTDFLMTVSIIAEGPSFRILDLPADDLLAARREAKEAEEEPAATESDAAPDEIIADKRTRTYYLLDCHPDKPIPQNDQTVFKTIAEAEKAGYKKAKSCL